VVSMKDIAQKCNVSVATVSKALNGYSDIGKAKREEIRKCAEEMGYFPNSSARALKTNRTWDLGILFADNLHSGLTHSYFAAIIDSFKVTAEQRGYDITFTAMAPIGGRRMSYLEHCRYRGLDGVVIANIDFSSPGIQELFQSPIPVVTVDYVVDGRTAIVSNNVKGMHDLTDFVCRMGHRKLAYIHGEMNTVTRDRLTSFYRTVSEYGITVPDKFIRQSRFRDVDMTEQVTKELLSEDDLPTCIFYSDDFAAAGGVKAIRRAGLRIPEDISVCGYDGIPIADAIYPRLTTLRQDTKTIGRMAAEKLIGMIENPKTALVEKVLIDGVLEEGESVRRLV